jgi:hypothetical protein
MIIIIDSKIIFSIYKQRLQLYLLFIKKKQFRTEKMSLKSRKLYSAINEDIFLADQEFEEL